MQNINSDAMIISEIHQHYLNALSEPTERKGCWTFPKQIVGSADWFEDLWSRRKSLEDKNILLAWGMKDIAFREKELNYWIKSFPEAKIIRYKDAGHYIAEEKANELAGEIEELLGN